MKFLKDYALVFVSVLLFNLNVMASDDAHTEAKEEKFNPTEVILHHISDAHEWHIADWKNDKGEEVHLTIPLPVIVICEGQFDIFLSSAFEHGHRDVIKGDKTYRLNHGHIEETSGASVLDFSITRNVASLFMSMFLLIWIFTASAKHYKAGIGAPKGIASFMEPLILFVRDDIAIPNIGEKHYARFLPFLLTIFFFIWINNLIGLVPFFPGGSNLTGNIAFTMVMSVITLIVTNVNANKDYWKHIFMPPVPVALWPIMIPVEIIGVFSKPFALMVRLFANITAGHIIILSLVSLIFIFQTVLISPVSVAFVLFMNFIELLVAALQAYIFTLLTALFIGSGLVEHHHDHEEAHH